MLVILATEHGTLHHPGEILDIMLDFQEIFGKFSRVYEA